jgi:hypothetical protein
MRCARRSIFSWSAKARSRKAAMPIGTVTQNTQYHSAREMTKAPSTGPMIAAMPQMLEKNPAMRARIAGGYMSPIKVWLTGCTAPAPKPWMTRKPISVGMFGAKPHRVVPARKRLSPKNSTRLRPKMSASLP